MNIDEKIKDLINELGSEFKVLEYVYNAEKFIEGVTPIYYSGPYWDEREVIAAIKTLLVGKWLSSGDNVQQFEIELAKKVNQKYGLMVNSGSSANLIMIAALKKYFKWEDNSEIIVSVVGFPTTISVISQNNLKPIFIDIEMNTLNFDIDKIEKKITDKTKAIFVSPVLGNSPDFDKLNAICVKYNLQLILDNCDSLGSKWKGKFLNEYAIASSYSFYASHVISTGEGGMITSNNKKIIDIARKLITWGRECFCSSTENLLRNGICKHRFDKWLKNYDGIIDHKYVFGTMGYNLKTLDLQGSIGLVQVDKLEEIYKNRINSKVTIGNLLEKHIADIRVPKELNDDSQTVWFGTPIICKDKIQKDRLVDYLEKHKIQTRNYFAGNILLHEGFEHLDDYKNYPEAMKVLDLVFFIGAAPHYGEEVFNYIEKILKGFDND